MERAALGLGRWMVGDALSATRVIASATGAYERLAPVRTSVDRDGDVLVAFKSAGAQRSRVLARRWLRGGSLGPRLAISPRRHAVGFHHALAGDRQGDAVVAWTRMLPDDRFAVYGRPRVAHRPARRRRPAAELRRRPSIATCARSRDGSR